MAVKDKKKQEKGEDKQLDQLVSWRRDSFYKVFRNRELLGEITPDDIETLIKSTATHHDLVRLLDKGCPPVTAIKILA